MCGQICSKAEVSCKDAPLGGGDNVSGERKVHNAGLQTHTHSSVLILTANFDVVVVIVF